MAPVGLVNAADPRGRVRGGPRRRGRAPVLVRPGGGRGLRGGGGRGLRTGRRPRPRSSTTCLALAKDGTRAAIEAVCEVAAPAHGLRVGARPAARGGRPLRHGRPRLPRPVPRRPPPLPAALHRGTPDRPRHVAGRRRRLPPHGPRLGQLRPGLRLHRHDERRDRRRPGLGAAVPRTGRRRSRRPAASTCRPRRPTLTEVTREIFARGRRPPPRPRGGVRRQPVTAADR